MSWRERVERSKEEMREHNGQAGFREQMCADSNVADHGPTGTPRWARSTETNLAESRKQSTLVRHVLADLLLNLGAEGKLRVSAEGVKNSEVWQTGKRKQRMWGCDQSF